MDSNETDDDELWKSIRWSNTFWKKDNLMYLQDNVYYYDKVHKHEVEYTIQGSNVNKIDKLIIYTLLNHSLSINSNILVEFANKGSKFKYALKVSYNHTKYEELFVNRQIIRPITK